MNWWVPSVVVLVTTLSPVLRQAKPVQSRSQAPVDAGPDQSQAASPIERVPTFHSEARLVLITARVWKRTADKHPDKSLIPAEILSRYPPEFLQPLGVIRYAERLDTRITQSDFHVFDNGAEQNIHYFKRTVSPLKDETREEQISWRFFPTSHGTWGYPPGYFFSSHESAPPPPGFPPAGRYSFSGPDITYVIGYVPQALEPSKCHDVRIVVDNHDVGQDRSQYCAGASRQEVHDLDETTREGTDAGTKMRVFADSEASGSIKVSAQAYAFWSSRVSQLTTQNAGIQGAPPSFDLSFASEVRDFNAPARIHVSVEFALPRKGWMVDCREDSGFSLHVLGIAYKEDHQIGGQFGDTFRCKPPSESVRKKLELLTGGSKKYDTSFPSRLDAETDLSAGDYELRVVVSDGEKEFGRARLPLHVENLRAQQLAISDIVLSSFPRDASKVLDDAAMVSPAQLVPAPLISKNVQFLPDTETRIAQHMRLPVYFEIYEPLLKQQTIEVYMHLRAINLKTGLVALDSGRMSAANWVMLGNPVVPIGFNLGVHELSKGDYRIEVQASDATGRESAWRQAKFSID